MRKLTAQALAALIVAIYSMYAYGGNCQDGGILFKLVKNPNNGRNDIVDATSVDGNCKPIYKACNSSGYSICKEGSKRYWGQDPKAGSLHINKNYDGDQEDKPDATATGDDPDGPPGCCIWTKKGVQYTCWKWAPC